MERAISRFRVLGKEIIVVCAPSQKLPHVNAACRYKLVFDAYPGKGPLVGIYSGLRASNADAVFVSACDMPFVNPGLVSFMLELSCDYDVVIPKYDSLLEPLHAVYSSSCVEAIEVMIQAGDHKIDRLLDGLKVKYVNKAEMKKCDPEGLSFFNINTPEDLVRARDVASRSINLQGSMEQ